MAGDFLFKLRWGHFGIITPEDCPVASHQEFGEIPADGGLGNAGVAGFQVFVKRMGVAPVDVDFGKGLELGLEIDGTESGQLLVGFGGLSRELVAREIEDFKTLVMELLVQFLQSVVLLGVAAVAGRVHDQQHLAAILFERDDFALGFLDGDGVDGHVMTPSAIAYRSLGNERGAIMPEPGKAGTLLDRPARPESGYPRLLSDGRTRFSGSF